MINAVHTLIYSDDATATRRFFVEVLRWPFVSEGADGGAGTGGVGTGGTDPAEWLIFRTGPSELGVHPTMTNTGARPHQIALMCDDLTATIAELSDRGAEFVGEPHDSGFGYTVMLKVPGADDILLYQPKHAVAYDLEDAQ